MKSLLFLAFIFQGTAAFGAEGYLLPYNLDDRKRLLELLADYKGTVDGSDPIAVQAMINQFTGDKEKLRRLDFKCRSRMGSKNGIACITRFVDSLTNEFVEISFHGDTKQIAKTKLSNVAARSCRQELAIKGSIAKGEPAVSCPPAAK